MPGIAQAAALERGVAITDPWALRELDLGEHAASGLDRTWFGLRPFVTPTPSAGVSILHDELFSLPSMVPVRKALDKEFDRYIARHAVDLPRETIGVGASFDWQMFDRDS